MKVVTSQEMVRVERLAYLDGASEELFMQRAGEGIAFHVEKFIKDRFLEEEVTILIGKGNKGGDGFTAGTYLIERGFEVVAVELFPYEQISPLAQKKRDVFLGKSGRAVPVAQFSFPKQGIILDALLGTGFHGQPSSLFSQVIQEANSSCLPIVSIDIPSGLDGTTGEAVGGAIVADLTISLGLAKSGLFLKEGWNHVGKLVVVDFGLGSHFVDQAKADFICLQDVDAFSALPKVVRNRHKYQTGYLLGVGGGRSMTGAAKLSSLAAFRSGAGIVRLFYPEEAKTEMAHLPYEVIATPFQDRIEPLLEEMVRAQACFIGPGLGREERVFAFLSLLLPKVSLPTVLDADALYFLSLYPHTLLPKRLILTPHRKEMFRLLGEEKIDDERDLFAKCQAFAEKRKCVIVLKGAPTVIFSQDKLPVIVPKGDPAMAKAGVGDVLTGVIGALLAQRLPTDVAAYLGVYLHASAGEIAGGQLGPYSMVASDLIEALPASFVF